MEEQQTQGKKSNKTLLVVIVIIVVIGAAVGVYFFTQSEDESITTTTTTNTAVTTNTEETTTNTSVPTSNAKPHDGKIINVTSADGKIEGLAGIKYTEFEGYEYIVVGFFFKIHDAFFQKSDNVGNFDYSLVANHIKSTETRVDDGTVTKGTNMLGSIYCEKDFVPDVFELVAGNSYDQTVRYIDCTWGTPEAWADTDSFYYEHNKSFSIDTFTLEDIYEINKLEIYEGSQYWIEEDVDDLYSAGLDTAAVYASAPIIATYTLEFEEQ